MAVVAIAVPFLPLMGRLGFVPVPVGLVAVLVGITTLYVVCVEVGKLVFYRRAGPRG